MFIKRKKKGRPTGTPNIKRTYLIHRDLDYVIGYLALFLYRSKNSIVMDAIRIGLNEIMDREGILIKDIFKDKII